MSPATRARLLAGATGGAGALAGALRRGQTAAAGLLPPLPTDAAGWAAAVAAVGAAGPRLPAAALEALAAHQTELGAGPRAVAAARSLTHAVAVVTGQQPGLFGGPLLAFHKAAGAVALARRLEALTGQPVVPAFWLASEDHDVEEANRVTLLDRDGQPREITLPVLGDGRSLVDLDVPSDAWERLAEQARGMLPDTARARAALALLARRADEPFSAWSARCLTAVLGDSGLVILEPRRLTPWLGPVVATLARRGLEIQHAVRESAARLRALGLPAPLSPRAEDLPLFLRDAPGGPRRRLGLEAGGRLLRDGRPLPLGLDALVATLEAQPALASPDVTGRVFAQNALLPVLAYVAGPTELAYLAQVSGAHRALGRPFPLAVPRPSAVWVDARGEQSAAAFGRTLDEVLRGEGPQREPGHPAVESFLGEVREALEERRRRAALLVEGGAGGAQALRAAVERLIAAWEKSRPAVHAAYEADDGVAAGRWTRLQNFLFPRGRPQERTLSILTLLARYGLDSVREGLAALDPSADGVWLLRADDPPGGSPTP